MNNEQGVSGSQKFRVQRGFPNYRGAAISQFGSGKNSYKYLINLFFATYNGLLWYGMHAACYTYQTIDCLPINVLFILVVRVWMASFGTCD